MCYNGIMLFRKTDFFVIAALLCAAFLVWMSSISPDSPRLYAEIFENNRLVKRVPLTDRRGGERIELSHARIEISGDGGVAFVHSDCPDQVCVHSGSIRRGGEKIACVPNQILVQIVDHKEEKCSASFTGSFNTVSNAVSSGLSETEFAEAAEYIREELHRLHLLYSIYDDGTYNLKYINAHGKGEYPIHPDLAGLLLYANEVYRMSSGKVDITAGRLLSLWHRARETGQLPSETDIAEAVGEIRERTENAALSGVFDGENFYEVFPAERGMILSLRQEGILLDVGALAKGYALDLLCERLSAIYPNASFLISLGGNIRSAGEKSDWVIGIRHPDQNAVYASFVLPDGMAVATSGDYERYMEADGVRYHHIIDVATGYPANFGIRSVTVIAKSGVLADALTTALFLMPPEDGLKFAERQNAEVFYILDDWKVITSKGFPAYKKP